MMSESKNRTLKFTSCVSFLIIVCGLSCKSNNQYDDACLTRKDEQRNSFDVNVLYPHLNVVPVDTVSAEYHAEQLMKAHTPEECAYQVIAIGLIKKDTPEVRTALIDAAERFMNFGVPQGYDWPDNVKRFKSFLEEHPDEVVDHYPGNRMISMLDLIDECAKRIGIQQLQ